MLVKAVQPKGRKPSKNSKKIILNCSFHTLHANHLANSNNLKITTNISYPFIHVKKFRDFRNFMIYVKFMKGYPKWSRDFDDDFNRQILNVKGWSLGN